jgi:menaquinone-9 beta-reductase
MIESRVSIIGAGPAGTTTALFLSKLGIPSLLVDRSSFPRDKICGDCLGGYVISVLKQLGDDIFNSFITFTGKIQGRGVHFFSPKLYHLSIPATQMVNGVIGELSLSKRIDFDNFLFNETLQRRNIEVRTGLEISGFSRDSSYLILQNRAGEPVIRTRIAVIATGSQSKIANDLSQYRINKKHLAGGVRSYYEGVESLEEEGYIEFHFLRELTPGYLWIFPIHQSLYNVGIGLRSDVIAKKNIDLKKLLPELISSYPHLRVRFEKAKRITPPEGFPLALGSGRRKISGNNFLLAGDSASLIEPFFGEGIGNAMYSGKIAAEHIAACLSKNAWHASFNRQYDKAVFRKLNNSLKLGKMLQKVAFYPSLVDRIFRNTSESPRLLHLLSNVINGDIGKEPFKGLEFIVRSVTGF